ncbi:hypothetical protein H0486_03735 [Lachnospiraceae bacterium MD1]|uniref:Tetratricopeptide repeat protein n=1 Tax=Variimorphobacter saccharofermentans TaxID=2755051 RepID=A0A839JWD1_9FIRM|nr:hypothetical protein [Variimorphobacter saccharofermentans]MBB2181985.1 hypothetical protein [Variimorphobacter saccharofermentans]
MICPNCGSNMSDKKKRCERCGTDLTIYKKIYNTSNVYYNDGLAKAKVRDLSGATVALRRCLELNKLNTNARNLLGLVYYEMGETVAALSEWVISKHFQPKNNDADEYIEKVQSNPTRLDALNQAIKRYNTALGLAVAESDDLAIIQLKKVVTLNPHFIRAYQLLALLHMKIGENERARKYLLKAAKIDVSNTTTLRYLRELEGPAVTKDMDSNPEAESPITASIMPINSYREDKPNIMAFVNLVVGVVIGVAVMAFLVLPTIKNKAKEENNSNIVDYGTELAKIEEKDETIRTLQTEKDELTEQIEQLKAQIETYEAVEDNPELYDPLFTSAELYIEELSKPEKERDFTSIVDKLLDINDSEYETEASKALLESIRQATYSSAAVDQYEKGHALYTDGKYDEALVELLKAMTLNPEDASTIYFIARTYHRLDDKVNAALYYNMVISEFPDTKRASEAKSYLRQVQ